MTGTVTNIWPLLRQWSLPVLLLLVLAGWFLTPLDPSAQEFRAEAFAGPSAAHWLGVDGLGRDVFSRLWRGAANTVGMGLIALVATLLLGGALLWLERSGPRWVRQAVRGLVSAWVAVPVIFIGLLLLVFLQPSAGTLVVAAALGNVPLTFRQMRILWLQHRSALYVQASEVIGSSGWQILRYSIWPNLRPDISALARLVFAISVLELSGLAFLGLIGDPDFPELGAIMKQNQAFLYQAPMLVVLPGVLLSALLLVAHISRSGGSRSGG